ncbi:MAG: CoA transferase [Candidatus Lambdaproteobacteria bacterium]|nr:CoA transferase [Candidatus Lambdaproteobacteria bacterium]
MKTGALHGIRILDLSTVLMGPYATQILADMGADVIKIEGPAGDSSRYITDGRSRGMGGSTLNLHRNKRGLVLDLKHPDGKAALLRLAEGADVLFYNIRPQAMARLGLDYAALRAVNPRIVYCGAYGYRRDGPYGHKGAYDDLIQGASGIAALNGRLYGEPAYVPTVLCDKVAGLTAVYAITAALLHRERTGEGQEIEVPMFETLVSFTMLEHIRDHAFEPPLSPVGYARLLTRNRRPYRTQDGYACILPYTDRNWRDLFAYVGRPELAQDERYVSIRARTQHIDALYTQLAEFAATRTTAEWMAFCDRVSIPAAPVNDLADMWEDPHLRATGFFSTAEHPTEGKYKVIGFPVNFSASPMTLRRHAPRLGGNSIEVLREAGFSEAHIQRMLQQGATVDHSDGSPIAPPAAGDESP